MSLVSLEKTKTLVQESIVLELSKYRYLPLHLAVLYLNLIKTVTYLSFDQYYLTNLKNTANDLFTLNLIHNSSRHIYHHRDPILFSNLKDRRKSITINSFKTPFFLAPHPKNTTDEKAIIYARNKKLVNLVHSLASIESELHEQNFLPAVLIIPYLFLNKGETINSTNKSTKIESNLQYDPQNQTLRTKELTSNSIYGKPIDESHILLWFDSLVKINGRGWTDERNKVNSIHYLPKYSEKIKNLI